ncbi:MAG: hypothetical protein ACRDK0_02280, partial [Solirubrobacteraceae bacterium]
MELAGDILHYLNAAAALALAAVAAVQARWGGRPGLWGAAAFAALAVVLRVGAVGGEEPAEWVSKALVCVLLAFPYLLVRFAASLELVGGRFVRFAGLATIAVLLLSLVLPSPPEEGAPQPAWYLPYVVAVLAFWTALSVATIVGLWRGGAGQPTLTRRRTRLMSAATAAMNVLILLAPLDTGAGAGELVVQALLSVSLVSFAVGYAPPPFVRLAWRQPEQEALRQATEELVGAMTVPQVTDTLLPHVARIVGGSGAALCDEHRRVIASVGSVPAIEHAGEAVEIRLSPPFGALMVATTPLTPFFGREELALLHALAALADLSLARCV